MNDQVKLDGDTAYISLQEVPANFINNGKKITALVFENGVEVIRTGAIQNTPVTKIAFSSTIKHIEPNAIDCSQIKTVVIDKCDFEGKVHRYKFMCKQVFDIATVKDEKSPTGASIYLDYEGEE